MENVLAVRTADLPPSWKTNRFIFSSDGDWSRVVGAAQKYARTARLEESTSIKQICTYCLVEGKNGSRFVYRRPAKKGDAQLRELRSIGVGGHVTYQNYLGYKEHTPFSLNYCMIQDSVERELDEELNIKRNNYKYKFLGIINDDRDAVGRAHLGFAYQVTLGPRAFDEFSPNDEIGEGVFYPRTVLKSFRDAGTFESWSEILFDEIVKGF